MNKNVYYGIVSAGTGLLGIILFACMNGWIIFKFPSYKSDIAHYKTNKEITRKNVSLIFWHNQKWNSETLDLIWSNNSNDNVYYLINSWLNLLDEEQAMQKKIMLQTAMTSPSGNELFLSFDRNPLAKESSTFDKWMWAEGLLKTLRKNGVTIQNIRFLAHHQPINDDHLDFNNPWPVQGFIQS